MIGTEKVTVYLLADEKQQLERRARDDERSVSYIARRCITRGIAGADDVARERLAAINYLTTAADDLIDVAPEAAAAIMSAVRGLRAMKHLPGNREDLDG